MPRKTQKYSNKISASKFIFFSVVSFGLYHLIWIYRLWKFFKEKDKRISAFGRTVLTIIYLVYLFQEILKISKKNGYKEGYSPGLLTIIWFAFVFVGNRLPDPFWLVSLLSFLPFLWPLKAANYCWDKEKLPERPLKWWHMLLIFFGIILWLLVIIGFTIPD